MDQFIAVNLKLTKGLMQQIKKNGHQIATLIEMFRDASTAGGFFMAASDSTCFELK